MPRRYNKKKQYKKRYSRKPKSNYRSVIPRTIQIATKRNQNQKLKFVLNHTWIVDQTQLANGKTAVLSYRANSIFASHMPTGSNSVNAFISQNPEKYSNNGQQDPVINANADGWNEWTNRYQHFCVTGSKMTYSYEPTGTGTPAILFSHLSGVGSAVTTDTKSSYMNELPFSKRHSLSTSPNFNVTSGGIRGSLNYSARKFEGVVDPEDNTNLRGRFANPNLTVPTVGATPGEQSFFYIALAAINPAATMKLPPGVLRVKIEYITQMKEPTETNQIQVITDTANAPDEL